MTTHRSKYGTSVCIRIDNDILEYVKQEAAKHGTLNGWVNSCLRKALKRKYKDIPERLSDYELRARAGQTGGLARAKNAKQGKE